MKTNLYISNLDTPLSYHIAQFFREDHHEVDPSRRIVGSCSQPVQLPWIHASIDFQKYPQLSCRTVLDCDIVILDLRSQTHEAETIIKFLKKANSELAKSIRVIGISSLLTWEGTKAYELQPQNEDKESMMASIVDQNKWRPIQMKDSDYRKRVPNVLANRIYQLENMVLSLNQAKIKASIIGVGMIYGKQSEAIQSDIVKSLTGEPLTIWGDGDNFVPFVHIQSFLKSLRLLIDSDIEYAVARDQRTFTQKEVKQMILKATGSKGQLVRKQPLYVTEEESLWSFQQNIGCSQIFSTVSRQRHFQSYCFNEMMGDLCEYTEWNPCQSILLSDQFEQQALEAVKGEVRGRVEIISEEDITKVNQQILLRSISIDQLQGQKQKQTKKLSRQQLIQQELQTMQPRYAEAIQTLLANKKYLNFLVICNSKIKEFISHRHFFKGIVIIVQQPGKNDNEKQIVYQSQQWYQFTGIEEQQKIEEHVEAPVESEPVKDVYAYQEGRLKKDQRLVLTTQYLLDNVLGAISEAKFNLRAKKLTGLGCFIEELKEIYNRGNYQSSLGESQAQPLGVNIPTMTN